MNKLKGKTIINDSFLLVMTTEDKEILKELAWKARLSTSGYLRKLINEKVEEEAAKENK